MAAFPIAAYVPRLLLTRSPGAPRQWTVDGSLMFVDISGFTKLSDQLARRGHEGAEELVRTLVRIFTVLLSASDDGGDVVKFGGDAMAVLYTGPDHERRSCHAAYVMQKVIGVIGRVELTGARAQLRMSIGIHSGTFQFALAGQTQHDLVTTGEAVTRTLELESAAEAGEILVSPRTAAHLRASELGARKGPGVLVRRVGTVVSTGSQILFTAPPDEQLWRYVPVPFQHQAERLTANSDHRRVAVAFVAVTGLDEQAARDPEALLAQLDQLAAVVQDAAAETGVTVLDTDLGKDGFKYMLVAGAPITVEDPEGRMIRALLQISQAPLGLAVQSGCTSGRVFAGTVGAPFRSAYATMGDTTNLAARLCAKAAPGEVLAHEPMLRRSLTEFACEATRHLVLKGKPDPEPATPVTAVTGQRGRTMQQVDFVGREKELDAIAEAYAPRAEGHGAVVQIIGEPGLGKSRLAMAALSRLGHEPWWFAADPYGQQVPYATLRVVLRRLLGIPADARSAARAARLRDLVAERCPDLQPWLPLLGPVLGAELGTTPEVEALDEQFRADRLRDTVRRLVRTLLPGEAVLVFDDAHWMDQASADALELVLSDLRDRPWAVVITRRNLSMGLHSSERLGALDLFLEPMDADVAQVLLARHERILRPDEVEAIVERAGGNPYFLLQLAEGGVEELPETVEQLIGTRLDALDPLDRDLLRNAAVIGSRFSPELYAAATGDHQLATTLASGILDEYLALRGGEVVFSREIHREVAYGQLTFRGRRQLHRRTAEAIEAAPELAGTARLPMLSLHYAAAGMWDQAFRASWQAGEAAAAEFANDEAIEFFRRAVAASRNAEVSEADLASLHVSLADACEIGGRLDEADRAYRRAMRLTPDSAEKAGLMVRAGRVLDHLGEPARARRLYRSARRLVAGQEEVDARLLAAEVDLGEAASLFLIGRHARARELAERASDVAEHLPTTPRSLRARARAAFLHDSAAALAYGARGVRFGDQPLEIYEKLGDNYFAAITCNNLGVNASTQGRWADATSYWRRGRDFALRAGALNHATYLSMNLAETRGLQGDVTGAARDLEQALRSFRAMGVAVGAIAAQVMLAALAVRSGEHERAHELLDAARAEAVAIDDGHDVDEADALELELLLAEGRASEVVARAASLLARDLEPIARTRSLRVLGLAHGEVGDLEAARSILLQALTIAVDAEAAYEGALTQAALADLAGPDAERYRRDAADTFERLGVAQAGRGEV